MSTESLRALKGGFYCPAESEKRLEIIWSFEQTAICIDLALCSKKKHFCNFQILTHCAQILRHLCRPLRPAVTTDHNGRLLWLLTMTRWKPWLPAVESQLLLTVVCMVDYGLKLICAGPVLEKHRMGVFFIWAFDPGQVGAIVLHWRPCCVL